MDTLRQTGIEVVGAVPWGTHFCQFYETSQDLVETLVPYFHEGLAANEFCMWVTSPPLQVEEATAALRAAVPDLDDYIARGQIAILDYSDWYTKSGEFRGADEVLQGWVDKHDDALRRGHEGLRLTGNTFWLEQSSWDDFARYEEAVNNVIGQYRMLALCTYSLEKCGAQEIAEVIATHQFALIKRSGRWQIIESSRHRLTEEALRENERKLAEQAFMLANISDAVIAFDREYRITYWNPSAERMFGYKASEVTGKSGTDILRPIYVGVTREELRSGLRDRGHLEVEFVHQTRDGRTLNIESRSIVLRNDRGEDIGHLSVNRDITDRNQAEEAARETRDYLENLIDYANAPIIVWDPSFTITRFNHAFERLTGHPASEVVGQRLEVLFPEDERAASMEQIARTLRGEFWELIEIPILHQSGEVRRVLWNSANITGPDGRTVVATIAQGTDITERKRTEETLRETRDYLEKLIDYANAPIIVWDPSFTITRFNRAFERLTGRPASEVVGQRLEVLFPEPERGASMEQIARTLRGEFWELIEIPILHESGEVRRVLWNSANITGPDGQTVVATIAQGTDITERKQAEQILREQREDLNRAQAVARTGSWRLDVRHDQLLWSDETYRMFGVPKGTPLTYEAFLGFVHPEDRASVDQAWTAALRGQPYDIEHRIVVSDSVKWVRERAELELDKDGTLLAGFGTVQDITERRQAEEAIEQERQRLQALVDASPVGIVLADADGRLLLVNREAERIFGYSPIEADSGWYDRAVRRRPDGSVYARAELPLERALRQGETVRAEEVWFELSDGRIVPTLTNATPVYAASGEIAGAIAIIQDITPLEEVEKVRSEFLGMVTHELKTPLTAIKGSAATALGTARPLDAAQVRELFEIINGQADRLRELVDDLLDMTRIEAGSLSIDPEPLDLRTVVEETLATFFRTVGLREVRLELPDALPLVKADRGRIGQVMTNLLTNAAKFSPSEAPITISAEQDPLSVTVHVRDEGRGIAREKLPLLFKKFSRLHEDNRQKLSSTGLGLAISKGIVEAHGGRIWADSVGEGQGTTFSFSLPIAVQEASAAAAGIERGAVQVRKVTRPGKRARVLAVDDEPHILRYLQRSLSEAGYQAIVTGDPSQVAGLVELEEPDLVVLDLRLPGISGFDLLQRIRELSAVPVIFLTASDREEDAVQALKAGADDYITKPFSPSELLARIEAVLRRRAATGPMETRRSLMLEDLAINFAEREVTLAGRPVSLTATEYKLLYELATHAGRVLTYDQILQRVWGPEYSGETELVRSFVRNLRRKLGDDAYNPRFILTERQVGYRMPKPQA